MDRTGHTTLAEWTAEDDAAFADAVKRAKERTQDIRDTIKFIKEGAQAEKDAAEAEKAAKEVLDVLVAEGGDPASVVEAKGLGRAESGELESIVDQAIADNPDAVEKIRSGKPQAIGAIVGTVMRETKGRADGGEVQRMISEKIGA